MAKIQWVGIAGAGTMGRGIAQVFAQAGYKVILYDTNPAALENARKEIHDSLQKLEEKNKITSGEAMEIVARICTTNQIQDLSCQLVVEAVAEVPEVKRSLFQSLSDICPADALLTTNTSSLSVTELATSVKHPQLFAGLHFFNPAPLMKLVEIIRGAQTADETLRQLTSLVTTLGKVPVHAHDSPGFIVNRVARPYYTEALKLLEEQVADIRTIDRLMRASGFRMGPFELMDLIGVDVNYAVTRSLFEAFSGEVRFRPSRIQEQKVRAGQLGRKSGKGFYDYG
jgi:3-hydroxybutyryl-CoA dehydrogenase